MPEHCSASRHFNHLSAHIPHYKYLNWLVPKVFRSEDMGHWQYL